MTTPPIGPNPQYAGPLTPPPRKKSKIGLIVGLVIAGVLVLCGGGAVAILAIGGAAVNEAAKEVEAEVSNATSPCAGGQCSSPTPAAQNNTSDGKNAPIPFGAGKWTYADGIAVQVNSVKKWKVPSINSGHTSGNSAVKVQVTLHNGTEENFDCSLAGVEVSMGANGTQAGQVFAEGVDSCTGSVAPGRKKTFTVGFSGATKDLSVIQVAVTPSWDHEDGIFEGRAA